MMKKVSLLVLAIALLALASCKSSLKSEESVSNINNALQDSVEAILEKHLVEYGAMDGVAIVMETDRGRFAPWLDWKLRTILPMLERIPWLQVSIALP